MKKSAIALLVLSCLFFSHKATCQVNPEYIDSLFYGRKGMQKIKPDVGLSIGVINSTSTSYYSFGYRARDRKLPVDSNTVFEIGSNTKIFTALLLAIEIENGTVNKEDYIDKYLSKGFNLNDNLKQKIKLVDLASFSSGLPTLNDDVYDSLLMARDSIQPYALVNKKYLQEILNNTHSLNDYGSYNYSNYSYGILGVLLEKITGEKYNRLIRDKICNPLHLSQTYTDKVQSKNIATGYFLNKPVEYLKLNSLKPAGVIKSSAVDMITFLSAQLNPSATNIGNAIKLTHQVYLNAPDKKLGLTWHIIDEKPQGEYYYMRGDTFGYSSALYFDKKADLGIVIMINESNPELVGTILKYLIWKMYAQKSKLH